MRRRACASALRRCVSWPRRDRAAARCRVAAWTRRVNCGACQEHFACRCAASPESLLNADTPAQPLGATTLSPAAGQQLALATRRPRLWLRGWRVPRALLRAHAGLCAHSPPRSRTSSAAALACRARLLTLANRRACRLCAPALEAGSMAAQARQAQDGPRACTGGGENEHKRQGHAIM